MRRLLTVVTGVAAVSVCLAASSLLPKALAPTASRDAPPATRCATRVLDDWVDDGRVQGTYRLQCYRAALKALPEDLRAYSTAPDDLTRQLQDHFANTETGAFDQDIMGRRVFERAFEIVAVGPGDLPTEKSRSVPLGRHLDGCRTHGSLAPRERVGSCPPNLLRRERRRLLQVAAAKVCERPLDRRPLDPNSGDFPHDAAGHIVGVRGQPEAHVGVVGLEIAGEQPGEPRRTPEQQDEHAGCQRIERARMTDLPLSGGSPDRHHHVVRAQARRLVHDQHSGHARGVVVVAREEAGWALDRSRERAEKEGGTRARLVAGELGVDIYGLRATLAALGVEYVG